MTRKEDLWAIIRVARDEVYEIDAQEKKEKNKKYIGKYFRFRNSFSCPEPDEYWYLYTSVIGMDEYGDLKSWGFQKDVFGKIEIETKSSPYIDDDSYVEISYFEFYSKFKEIMVELDMLNILQNGSK